MDLDSDGGRLGSLRRVHAVEPERDVLRDARAGDLSQVARVEDQQVGRPRARVEHDRQQDAVVLGARRRPGGRTNTGSPG